MTVLKRFLENNLTNVGTGLGIFKQKSGLDVQLKSALSGYGIAISSGTDELTWATKTAVTTLTNAATILIDASTGPQYMLTIAGNHTLGNPSNAVAGQDITLLVAQDGTGGWNLAFGTDWIATDPTTTLNPTISAVSLVYASARDFGGGVKWYYTIQHAADTSSGESNTASNVGTGVGVFKAKVLLDLQFKSLLAGYGTAITGGTNEVTVAEKIAVTTLTDGATIAIDASLGPNYEVTLGGNRTLSNPSNAVAGQILIIGVKQDATGGRTLAFDTDFISASQLGQVSQAISSVSMVVAEARSFGGTLKWYYTIDHGESSYVISPAQITADQIGYSPTGWGAANTVRLDTDASRNIAGFVPTVSQKHKKLINVGAFNIVINNQSGTETTAANRVICQGATDITMVPDDVLDIEYDATTARWRVV